MPSSTFRAWAIGLIWAAIIPGVNQFFSFRYPSVTLYQVSEKISPRRFSLPSRVSDAKLNPSSQAFSPPAVEFSNLQGLGSLPAEYFLLRYFT